MLCENMKTLQKRNLIELCKKLFSETGASTVHIESLLILNGQSVEQSHPPRQNDTYSVGRRCLVIF